MMLDNCSFVHNMSISDACTYNDHLYGIIQQPEDESINDQRYIDPAISDSGNKYGYHVKFVPRLDKYNQSYLIQSIINGVLDTENTIHISLQTEEETKVRRFRMDYNPDKIHHEFMLFLKDEFNNYEKNPFTEDRSFTRLDFAENFYGKRFSDYQYMVDGIPISLIYPTGLYIGAKSGSHWLIYDKAIEQGLTGEDWLRIEYKYKPPSPGLTPEALFSLQNQLARLKVLSPLKDPEKIQSRNKLQYLDFCIALLMKGGTVEEALKCMGKNSKTIYRPILQEPMQVDWFKPAPTLDYYYRYGLQDFCELFEIRKPAFKSLRQWHRDQRLLAA